MARSIKCGPWLFKTPSLMRIGRDPASRDGTTRVRRKRRKSPRLSTGAGEARAAQQRASPPPPPPPPQQQQQQQQQRAGGATHLPRPLATRERERERERERDAHEPARAHTHSRRVVISDGAIFQPRHDVCGGAGAKRGSHGARGLERLVENDSDAGRTPYWQRADATRSLSPPASPRMTGGETRVSAEKHARLIWFQSRRRNSRPERPVRVSTTAVVDARERSRRSQNAVQFVAASRVDVVAGAAALGSVALHGALGADARAPRPRAAAAAAAAAAAGNSPRSLRLSHLDDLFFPKGRVSHSLSLSR